MLGPTIPKGSSFSFFHWGPLPTAEQVSRYLASRFSHNVSVFAINPGTGSVTAVGEPAPAGASPTSITVDSSDRFAYVAEGGVSTNVRMYPINSSTGELTAAGEPVATGALNDIIVTTP